MVINDQKLGQPGKSEFVWRKVDLWNKTAGLQKNCSYPFIASDGGRCHSRRKKQKNDCTVRALALAAQLPYDEAYDILAAAGRKCNDGFDFKNWAKTAQINRYVFDWIYFRPVKGQRRMNPVNFCNKFSGGNYIARTAKHVFAVIDGIAYDTFAERPDRCIYGCWALIKR